MADLYSIVSIPVYSVEVNIVPCTWRKERRTFTQNGFLVHAQTVLEVIEFFVQFTSISLLEFVPGDIGREAIGREARKISDVTFFTRMRECSFFYVDDRKPMTGSVTGSPVKSEKWGLNNVLFCLIWKSWMEIQINRGLNHNNNGVTSA